MRYVLCSIRDRKLDCFGQPFCVTHIGGAIRSFADEINNVKNDMFSKHPEDFDLYELGSYDDDHAVFTLHDTPLQKAIGLDLVIQRS